MQINKQLSQNQKQDYNENAIFLKARNLYMQQKYRIQDLKSDRAETTRKICTQTMPYLTEKELPIDLRNARLGRRKKIQTKHVNLQNLIHKHKVSRCVNNFIKKLRLNSVYRQPCQSGEGQLASKNFQSNFISFIPSFMQTVKNCNGMQIGNIGLALWSIINILQITVMVIAFSIVIAFEEVKNCNAIIYMRAFSIGLYLIDMVLNFTVARYESGKYLQKIQQISSFYLKKGFIVDLMSIMIFPFDVVCNLDQHFQIFIFLLSVIKLINNIVKFEKLEYLFITTEKREHYFGLVKVFICNFAIAHFLSIILNILTVLNQQQNWLLKLGVAQSPWFIRYVWGYYWGTTIMLTIGFGDISASNFQQAIGLTFIGIFSCIVLAYNISYVGSIISNIRQSQKVKKKKLKIFHQMCKDSFIPNQMQQKITNFIEEQYNIKQAYQFDTHNQILSSLPDAISKQYRKQSNKILFNDLGFFSNLSRKSLLLLAEQITKRITHPEEIVLKKGSPPKFMILQNGSLSFICRIRSHLDGRQMQSLIVTQRQKPKILTFDFIKNKPPNYEIKSIGYCIIYQLQREKLLEILKQSQMSYQLFCMYRDKDDHMIGQNNPHLCPICQTQYHNKFECNKLHYLPLRRLIVLRKLQNERRGRQQRDNQFNRIGSKKFTIGCVQLLKNQQKRFIEDNFDDLHYKEIQNIQKFYSSHEKEEQLDSNQPFNINLNNQNMKTTFLGSFSSSLSKSRDSGSNSSQLRESLVDDIQQGFKQKNNKIQRKSNLRSNSGFGLGNTMLGFGFNLTNTRKSNFRLQFGTKTIGKLQQLLEERKRIQFWDVQSDAAENFRYYFKQGNSQLLDKAKKLKKSKERMGYL